MHLRAKRRSRPTPSRLRRRERRRLARTLQNNEVLEAAVNATSSANLQNDEEEIAIASQTFTNENFHPVPMQTKDDTAEQAAAMELPRVQSVYSTYCDVTLKDLRNMLRSDTMCPDEEYLPAFGLSPRSVVQPSSSEQRRRDREKDLESLQKLLDSK